MVTKGSETLNLKNKLSKERTDLVEIILLQLKTFNETFELLN